MYLSALIFILALYFQSISSNNLKELEEHSISINTHSPKLLAHLISDQIKQNGFIFINNSPIGNDIIVDKESNKIDGLQRLSQTVLTIPQYYDTDNTQIIASSSNFTYTLGNVAGRNEIAPGINKVSGAPKQVLVTAHSEAAYLVFAPEYLVFACPGMPDISQQGKGGQTVVYSIDKFIEKLEETALGRNLLHDVAKYGVKYIRNDPSQYNIKHKPLWDGVNYPFWQKRFHGMDKEDITNMLYIKGQNVSWNQYVDEENGDITETLHTEWRMSGVRLHPITNKIVWFNQLYAMNGRYFSGHNVNGMDDIPHNERPLHTLIGNGRELSDKEYDLLDSIHTELAVLIPWDNTGDILAIDNFAYQHGRMPYNSYRNCVINWGRGVAGGQYIYNPTDFKPVQQTETVDVIKNDMNAIYKLLDKFKWYDTVYQHVSYRLDTENIILSTNSEEFSISKKHDISEIYKQIYEYREDINVIIHVNNPDIASVAMSKYSFLPIDQSYYMLYPVTHYFFDEIYTNITNILGTQSRLLLIEKYGMIVLGTKMEEAFTRLFYAIRAAQSQVLALGIHESVDDIIFPPQEIQQITIDQSLNFNADGYGYLEFKAWKRRYNLDIKQEEETKAIEFTEDEYNIRSEITKAYHILDKFGWIESIYQHITATLPDNDEIMLINAYGLEFGEVTIENLMEVTMNGTVVYKGNSVRGGFINPSGLALHAAVHNARNDANVVIHCHHTAISAVSVYNKGLSLNMMDIPIRELIGSISYHDFDSLSLAINKTALTILLSNGSNVIILRNHGILTIGETVKDAFNRLYYTIQSAEAQIKRMIHREKESIDLCQENNKTNIFIDNVGQDNYYNAWSRF